MLEQLIEDIGPAPGAVVAPAVSIVVVTRGPSLGLARLLISLADAQGIESAELLLGVSDPAQVERLRRLASHHLPRTPIEVTAVGDGFPGGSRNAVAGRARAPIILFLDDDVEVASTVLTAVITVFAEEDVVVAGGPNLTPPAAPAFEHLAGRVLASPLGTGPVRFRYSLGAPREGHSRTLMLCNLAIRTSAFVNTGFQPELVCAEENELLQRVAPSGGRFVHIAELAVYHHRRATLRLHLRQMVKYGFGRGQVIVRAPRLRQLVYLVPAFAAAMAVLLALAAPAVAALLLVAYLCAIGFESIRLGGIRRGPAALLVFLATHLGYALGTVAGLAFELTHGLAPRPAQGTRPFARESIGTFVSLVAGVVAGALSGLLIARALGPAGRGLFEVGRVLGFSLAVPAGLGVGRAVVVLRKRRQITERQLFGSVLWTLASGVLVAAVVEIALLTLARDSLSVGESLLVAGSIPLVAFFIQAQSALRGVDETSWFQASFVLRDLLFLSLVILALVLTASITAVLVAWFVHWLIAASVLAAVLARACGWPAFPRGAVRALIGLAVPQTLVVLLTQLHLRLDIVLLQIGRGASTVGQYAVAVGTVELLTYFALAMGFTLFPRTAEAAALDPNPSAGAERTAAALRFALAITLGAATVLEIVGPRLIILVFGSAYAEASTPLRALLPGAVAFAMFSLLANDFSARGRPWVVFAAIGGGALANLGLNLILIPKLGATGAALASTITYTATAAGLLVAFCRSTRTPVRSCLVLSRRDLRHATASLRGAAAPAR